MRFSLLRRFAKADEGVSLLEYGMLAALIAAACITVITALGSKLNTTLNNVNSAMP
jgi:pilus assembly protein Flp/PilA